MADLTRITLTERTHLRFCLALHRVLPPDGDGCWSPYSVASALGLVSRAARGETEAELVRLLAGQDADIGKQAELLRDAAELTANPGQEAPVLAVANTLWADETLNVNQGFVDELAGWPGNAVARAPFGTDQEAARRMINADVAETTRELIPELLASGSIDPETVAAVVNALYLKVAWVNPFQDRNTHDADFHAPGGTRTVPTMRQAERLGYAQANGWRLAALPAVGDVQAVVLLPDGDLADQESTMDEALLAELLSGVEDRQLNLALPRFSMDVRSELIRPLAALGLRTMFTPAADLSGLSEDERMRVSDVVHQAVLRVDEAGLEGAAATAAVIRMVSAPAGAPIEFTVDRPFLFLVRHRPTGAVYFLARVTNP